MNPVLVDSSVWIGYFRDGQTQDANDLDILLKSNAACLTPLVRAELLSGARTEKEYRMLSDRLTAVQLLLDPIDLWDRAAHARFRLARRGFQTSLLDLSIAVAASHYKCPLFTTDLDFQPIITVLPIHFYRPLARA